MLPKAKCACPQPVAEFIRLLVELDQADPLRFMQSAWVGSNRKPTEPFSWLLAQEAAVEYAEMKKVTLHGQVKGDGTALRPLRLFRRGGRNNYVVLWGLVQRPQGKAVLPVKTVKGNAVRPVESRADVSSTRGLEHIVDRVTQDQKVPSLLASLLGAQPC